MTILARAPLVRDPIRQARIRAVTRELAGLNQSVRAGIVRIAQQQVRRAALLEEYDALLKQR